MISYLVGISRVIVESLEYMDISVVQIVNASTVSSVLVTKAVEVLEVGIPYRDIGDVSIRRTSCHDDVVVVIGSI